MSAFIVKGLLRDRSRSLFPLLTVAIGVSLTVLLDAYLRGAREGIFDSTARLVCGHVVVTTRARTQQGATESNELALLGVRDLKESLQTAYPNVIWAERIRFGGLLDVPDSTGQTRAQVPITGLAGDLSPSGPERRLLRLDRALASGRLPEKPDEVLLSADLASHLGVAPGDRLTLLSSTMNGSMAVADFRLSGTVRFGVTAMDRGMVLADIAGVRLALDMEDAADEIVGLFSSGGYDDARAVREAGLFNARQPDNDFAPRMQALRDASGLGSMIDLISSASALIVAILVIAMSVVLWNAGLMGSLRRYGEIGIRLAIGESRGAVYRSLLAEAFVIGLVGSALGTAVGLGFSLYLQEVGINIGSMMKNATMVMDDVIRARVAPAGFLIGFLPGLLATFIGAAISGLGVYKRQTAQLAKEFSG
uniref:FtsX-like permease family protein n=1 Tax=candidate division WOR-3 bacterium TaxID=2052148 RepID=A0A7C4G9D5_UNCW3